MSNKGDALRALAELMDKAQDNVAMQSANQVFIHFGFDADRQREAARFVAENFRPLAKTYSDYSVYLERDFDGFKIHFAFDRSSLCRKELITKQVEEWVCDDALLGIADAN